MADTTWRLRYPTGATLKTQIEDEQGRVWNGSAYVPFATADWATYAVATPEDPAGSGRYSAAHPPSSPAGNYTATHTLQVGGSSAATDPVVGSGSGYWDGAAFGSGPPAADASADLALACVVADPAPTTLGFIMAMADGSAVPARFVWPGALGCFPATSATLPGGKFPVATYARLTDTTGRLRLSPPLPAAPADGEPFKVV